MPNKYQKLVDISARDVIINIGGGLMEFKVGMEIHDINSRKWWTVIAIDGDEIVLFSEPFCRIKRNKKEVEEIYNASPVNPKEVK